MGDRWKVTMEPGWDQAKQAVVPDAIEVIGDDSEPQMFVCDMATPAQVQLAAAAPELLEALKRRVRFCTCKYDSESGTCPRCRQDTALLTRLVDPGDGRR